MVFTIRGAFRRREKALEHLSRFRASLKTAENFFLNSKIEDSLKTESSNLILELNDALHNHLSSKGDDASSFDAKVNASLGINSVQERIYRGFKRDQEYFDEVREQFIDKKLELINLVAGFESEFSNPKEFKTMFDFMNDFYEVLEDEDKFEKTIIAKARTK